MMVRHVEFVVYGVPQAKGSVAHASKGLYIPAGTSASRKAKKAFHNAIRAATVDLLPEPLDGPLWFALRCWFEAPKNGRARHRVWHDVPPDLDKVLRAVWDALQPDKKAKRGLITNDSRIVRVICADKRTIQDGSKPRIDVAIGELDY